MTRILKMLVFLFVFYYIVELLFVLLGPGYKLDYKVITNNQPFVVKETYVKGNNKELKSYYLTISVDDIIFDYQIISKHTIGKKVITDIMYYHDEEYYCILPVFKNEKWQYDITCQHNNKIDYYYNLRNKNKGLDEFANNMTKYGYKTSNFDNNTDNPKESNNMLLYEQNIIDGYNLAITMRKSVYTSRDEYQRFTRTDFFSPSALIPPTTPIRTYVNNFVIIADYSQTDAFTSFILVNRDGNNRSILNTPSLSFNSYIQGVVGDSFYLIDRDAKKQYEINVKDRSAVVVGTVESKIKYYNNGIWEKRDFNEALTSQLMFNEYITDVTPEFNGYTKVVQYGGKTTGYYYYFKKNGEKYDVYTSNIQNKNQKIYLFTATMENIKYDHDYIYFIENNALKYYSHKTGVRTLAEAITEVIVDYNMYYNN